MKSEDVLKIRKLAEEIGKESDADIFLISGGIERPIGRHVIHACRRRKCVKRVVLILVTDGGNADAAYRISRCFQDRYQNFTCLIPGICKSAGTIIALGANELAIGDHGELGPLDIQLRKADELWEFSSGLTAMNALNFLQQQAFLGFEKYMVDLRSRSLGQITTKTAAEIASNLCTGLYSHIYGQIDPMRLGENARSMDISKEYGERLGKKGKNLKENTVSTLAALYPSHGFVIDRAEAETLFKHVRSLSDKELELMDLLGEMGYQEDAGRPSFAEYLNGERTDASDIVSKEEVKDDSLGDDRRKTRVDPGSSEEKAGEDCQAPRLQEASTVNGSSTGNPAPGN